MTATHAPLYEAMKAANEWQEPLYKEFHQNPELSMLETETLAKITSKLDEFGYTTHQIGGGVVGVLENGEGPTVLLRSDFDGLPVQEQTGLPYASTKVMKDRNGVEQHTMHACGHDFHVTCQLGAAKVLADHRDAWSGTYLALFQPAEETAEGAQSMVDDDIVNKIPKPDVALGQHVMGLPAGDLQVASGPVMSTACSMKVTVYGKGSHGSMPFMGVDPIVLASAIVMRLQGIVSREISGHDFGVVSVGALNAGAQANIIPDRATMLLNFRAYDETVMEHLVSAAKRIVVAECEASRSPKEPEFEIFSNFPLTDNDEDTAATLRKALENHFGEDRVSTMPKSTGSEDFSLVPRAFGTPYTFWVWGGFANPDDVVANHHPAFAPDLQPTLSTGSESALTALLAFLGK